MSICKQDNILFEFSENALSVFSKSSLGKLLTNPCHQSFPCEHASPLNCSDVTGS